MTEIIEYAVKIGIDPEKETSIIYLARQGLLHPLPDNWKPWYVKNKTVVIICIILIRHSGNIVRSI